VEVVSEGGREAMDRNIVRSRAVRRANHHLQATDRGALQMTPDPALRSHDSPPESTPYIHRYDVWWTIIFLISWDFRYNR